MELFSDAGNSGFPRAPLAGDPHRRLNPTDVTEYLEQFEATLGVKTIWGVHALAVARRGDGSTLELRTTLGDVQTRNVVCATGAAAYPRYPEWSAEAKVHGVQMHSSVYETPLQVPRGRVLIVGGGNSGLEIAHDLAASHDVTLSVRTRRFEAQVRHFPSRPRVSPWRRSVTSREPLYGYSYAALEENGITIRPAAVGAHDSEFTFADGSRQSYESVIYATGYDAADDWLPSLPHSKRRIPTVTAVPGLFVAGIPAHSHARANTLPGAWTDASRIAQHIHARP